MSQSVRDRQDDIEGIVDGRQRDLVEFLKHMKTGNLKKAKALWTLTRVHLSDRKVDWYFSTMIDAGIIEVYTTGREKQFRFVEEPVRESKEETATEYMQRKDAEKRPKLSKKGQDFFEKCRIKEEMKTGPCKHLECPPKADDCRNCSAFRNLNSKCFLEEEE
jgi:hypothetical protein